MTAATFVNLFKVTYVGNLARIEFLEEPIKGSPIENGPTVIMTLDNAMQLAALIDKLSGEMADKSVGSPRT